MKIRLLEKELSRIGLVETASDAFNIACILSEIFNNMTESDLEKIVYKKFHIIFIEAILSNAYFNEKLFEVIDEEKFFLDPDKCDDHIRYNREDKKKFHLQEKQYIQSALYSATFVLAKVFHLLSREDVFILRDRIVNKLEYIRGNHSQHTIADICFSFYDTVYNFEYSFKEDVFGRYDIKNVFHYNKVSRCLVGIIMLIIPEVNVFQIKFKKISKEKDEARLSITRGLCEIYSISKKVLGGVSYFCREYSRENAEVSMVTFIDFFFTNNERNIAYIFKEIAGDFHVQKGKTFSDVFLQKIDNAQEIRKKISAFTKKNLKAFGNQDSDGSEWSNKIFLISNKLLATLEEIRDSSDIKWKIDVVIYELMIWIESVHKILNKRDIEDGWGKIERLIMQENSRVEWKSTFWTPTEELFVSDDIERKKGRVILSKIVEPMVAMMNTDGGTILVGLVENPEAIKREDVKRNLLVKNNFTFFDINYEFSKKKKSLDNAKREMQDLLFNITSYAADKFNDLWNIEPVEIKNNYSVATIYKIEVNKSENYMYKVKRENDALWVTLIKRADGRTIKVDPREYLKKA